MLSYAVFSLVTRYLASYDPAEVTLFYSLLAGSIVMAPFALAEWQWPRDTFVWLLLMSMGFYGGLGHYLFIVSHRYAPASTIAPLLFISLLPHLTAGYFVFGPVPGPLTLAGAVILDPTGPYLPPRRTIP